MKPFWFTAILLSATASAAETPAPPTPPAVPVEEIRRFAQVFQTLRESYVDELSDEQIMQAALRGLLADIDPHSSYLSGRQARDFEDLSEGGYAGIGIESDERDPKRIRVVAPFDDTPAQRAGLRAGDFITAINGRPVDNENPQASPERLRGEPGSAVRLTVQRAGVDKPFELRVVREVIRLQSVRARWLAPGYAYFRISAFQGDTGLEFRRQWQQLQQAAPGQALNGLVLDLRSNPGGLVEAAIEVADDFLGEVPLLSTKGRNPLTNASYSGKPGELFDGAPVAVLIDAGSASASEILAGALQDHRRATLIGSRSFGKGSVQSVITLDNGDAFKLTTARYYTPSGRSIQAEGIVPDVLLAGNARADAVEKDLRGQIGGGTASGAQAEEGVVLMGDAYIERALQQLRQSRR